MSTGTATSTGHPLPPADQLLAASVRSGLIETEHYGAFAAVDMSGKLIAEVGDIERPFYLRSSAKPFQALVSQEAGAELTPTQLAVAAASHDGLPAHVSIVESMLTEVGLDQDSLACPADWPLSAAAKRSLLLVGHSAPRRVWHNCSGKHAAWLRASVANGWPLDTYLDTDHPLQARIRELVSDVGGFDVDPVGVDGCGAPVMRTTVRAMATMFARFAVEDRFRKVFEAMHRYPALVSGVGNGDAVIGTVFDAAAKRGAQGCIGVSIRDHLGVGAKSWDGSDRVAAMAAAAGLVDLCGPSAAMVDALAGIISPPVSGGGKLVGTYENRLEVDRH